MNKPQIKAVGRLQKENDELKIRVKKFENKLHLNKKVNALMLNRLDNKEARIKELKNELAKIKFDPSIGKLIIDEWPMSPDY